MRRRTDGARLSARRARGGRGRRSSARSSAAPWPALNLTFTSADQGTGIPGGAAGLAVGALLGSSATGLLCGALQARYLRLTICVTCCPTAIDLCAAHRVQLTVLTKGAGEAAALKALDYLVTRLKAVAAPHGGVSKSGKACSQVVARLPPAN